MPDPVIATVVTRREDQPAPVISGLATTPAGEPDVQVIAMPWWQIVLVRTARVYAQSLLGFLTAAGLGATGAVGVKMPTGDFLHLFGACAGLALAPAVFTLIQNVVELLAKLDVTRPTLRA
jgi:hypothetical protein